MFVDCDLVLGLLFTPIVITFEVIWESPVLGEHDFNFFITKVCIMQEFLTVRLVAHTNKVIKTMAVASMILVVT
jgi:hypothetical protein